MVIKQNALTEEAKRNNKYAKKLAETMIACEENLLSERREILLFQEIIDSRLVWDRDLGEFWAKTARVFIDKGFCALRKV